MSARIRITVTVPEIILQSSFVRGEIERAMRRKTGPEIRAEFHKTVNGWNDQPSFNPSYHNTSEYVSTTVRPSGKGTTNYERVNNGVESHWLGPKRSGALHFKAFRQASTWPRLIRSQRSRRFGPYWHSKGHMSGVVEPREFDEVIALEYADTFAEDMQDAIRIAAVKSEVKGG